MPSSFRMLFLPLTAGLLIACGGTIDPPGTTTDPLPGKDGGGTTIEPTVDSGTPTLVDSGTPEVPDAGPPPPDAGTPVVMDAGVKDAGVQPEGPPPTSIALVVPWVAQKPELPRGCEVTSLAMLLRSAGVNAQKMTLAAEIDKVPYYVNGLYGNPNEGFVGDMYDFGKQGYGVYHAPVARLAQKYLPGRIVDITGISFIDMLQKHVGRGRPVLIITNATFGALSQGEFTTWRTRSGDVQITWHEHSVVITGYDPSYIYINDPLDVGNGKNKRLGRESFRQAWEQMGRQAITYLP